MTKELERIMETQEVNFWRLRCSELEDKLAGFGSLEFWLAEMYEGAIAVFKTKEEALENAWAGDETNVYHVREVLTGKRKHE